MENIFRGQEVLKIAVQIEKNGFEFFKEIADSSGGLKVQELFNYLANEETRHRQTFESMLKDIGDYTPVEDYLGEYNRYLQALAGENIFTKEGTAQIIKKKISSDIQAVDVGIGFEKDSIIFFNEMKNFTPVQDHKIIDQVIKEEKEHFTKLLNLKFNL